jgi:hypothetical protein
MTAVAVTTGQDAAVLRILPHFSYCVKLERMRKFILVLLIAVVVWKIVSEPGELHYGPGVMAAQAPQQSAPRLDSVIEMDGYKITPLADFKITAKVLSRRDYRFGREADLSPVDFALGWGNMSDESVLQEIKISQSNRWYRWQVREFPIPKQEIQTHSANMHIIPKDRGLARVISNIRKGSVVTLTGQLVIVDGDKGWQWTSSLSREDIGAHACELFLVESVETHLEDSRAI